MSAGELWTYLFFFGLLVAAGLGIPAPEEAVITTAGVMAGRVADQVEAVDEPVALPTTAEAAGLLAVAPDAGFPGALPWAVLVRTGAPHKLSAEDVAALMAVAPPAGFPGALPWSALVRASPPTVHQAPPPNDSIHVRWWILLPVCISGVVVSDILLYSIGRRYGDRLLEHRWLARILPRHRRERTERNFHRYGVGILIFGRLVPGIRSPLFLTAGTMRLPLPRFLIADALGAVVGNSLFFFLGFWLGDSFKTLVDKAEGKLKPILIVTGLGLLVAYLLWHFLHHPVSTGDPEEVPLIGSQVASHMDHTESNANHQQSPSDKLVEKKTPAPKD